MPSVPKISDRFFRDGSGPKEGGAHASREASPGVEEVDSERLRLALESVADGLWDLNVLTGELFVDHRWLGMLGLEAPVSTREAWQELCHPEDQPEFERRFHEHLVGRAPLLTLEYRMRHQGGEWVWVLCRGRAVAFDEQGRPLRMVGTHMDITASRHREERLNALVQVIPDLIFRMRSDGTFLDVRISDPEEGVMPPESTIGINVRDMPVPRSFAEEVVERVQRAIREKTLVVYEYDLEVLRGLQHYESRIVRSGPDEAVCIVRNITERKEAEALLRKQEEELRRHRDQLEELVHSRTEKLLQATRELEEQQMQLIHAEKMASLGQMAAGVAHEINNPVSYVTSNLGRLDEYVATLTPLLQLLRELLDAEEKEARGRAEELLARLRTQWKQGDVEFILEDLPELIEESQVGTRRIKEIARSLRMFAREDSGAPELVDVNAELESTLRMVWNELKYKCEVKRDYGTLPRVSCHPTQLTQVFANLMVNAAQAIETRGELRIRTRQEGSEVVVEIEDTGKGMTPETLKKLFTPFFTTKPRGQGTGLGLSISYGIISRHQGRIEVKSEPGLGSTFTIRLPAAKE
ncbi:MAG TPA: ATP-binding protein [Myxococcaceae bacterium]|nr:ATP-binding protein [Myxococcaceae bacterium]